MRDCIGLESRKQSAMERHARGKGNGVCKGNIVDIRPGKYLAYTTIDPNSNIDDVSENYLTVTYTLTEKDGQTLLAVAQGDYSKVAEGERRYQDSYNNGEGWDSILAEIKRLVETT